MSVNPYTGSATTEKPKSGGGAGKIILILIGVFGVLCLGCIGTCWYLFSIFSGAINKPALDLIAQMEKDTRVTAKLGTPITQSGFLDGGQMDVQISGNEAVVEYSFQGPDGSCDVAGSMVYRDDTWFAKDIVLTFDDGSTLRMTE